MTDPVPDALLFTVAALTAYCDARDWQKLRPEAMVYTVLSAADEEGLIRPVPQDEQGRERLVDLAVDGLRVEAGYDDEPDETVAAGMYDQAIAVLRALGLLPEQETERA